MGFVEHLLGFFTAARLRLDPDARPLHDMRLVRLVAGTCTHCDGTDPIYEPPRATEWSDEEGARRLAGPCAPSSDISTFTSPEDYLGGQASPTVCGRWEPHPGRGEPDW